MQANLQVPCVWFRRMPPDHTLDAKFAALQPIMRRRPAPDGPAPAQHQRPGYSKAAMSWSAARPNWFPGYQISNDRNKARLPRSAVAIFPRDQRAILVAVIARVRLEVQNCWHPHPAPCDPRTTMRAARNRAEPHG